MKETKSPGKFKLALPIKRKQTLVSSDYQLWPPFYPNYLRDDKVSIYDIMTMEYGRKWWDAERFYGKHFRNNEKKREILYHQRVPNSLKKNPRELPCPRRSQCCAYSVSSMTSLMSPISDCCSIATPLSMGAYRSWEYGNPCMCREKCESCPIYCTNYCAPRPHRCCFCPYVPSHRICKPRKCS